MYCRQKINSSTVLTPLYHLITVVCRKFVKDWTCLFYGFLMLSQTTWCQAVAHTLINTHFLLYITVRETVRTVVHIYDGK